MRMFLNGGYSMGLNFYCKTPSPAEQAVAADDPAAQTLV